MSAGLEHFAQRGSLRFGRRQAPLVLDDNPVAGVLAPVCPVRRPPSVGPVGALGPVGRRRDRYQVRGISQAVRVQLFALFAPRVASRRVGVRERHHVVDVQVPGVFHHVARVWVRPASGRHSALPVVREGYGHGGLRNQDLLSRVLAVAVRVVPMVPVVPIIVRHPGRAFGDGDAHDQGDGPRGFRRSCGRRRRRGWRGWGRGLSERRRAAAANDNDHQRDEGGG